MPPWNVAAGGLFGQSDADGGAAGDVGGAAEEGGSQFWGNEGWLIVEGLGGAVAPGTLENAPVGAGAITPGVVTGAAEVPAAPVPASGTGLGK